MTSPASRDPREWLARYVGLQQSVDRRVIAALNRADQDANKRLKAISGKNNISAKVERAQITEVRIAIREILAVMWASVGDTTRAAQQQAAATALRQGWDWDQVLLSAVYPNANERAAMRRAQEATAYRGVEAGIARVTGTAVPLSQRVYRARDLSQGTVDRRIESALVRGLSWGQFANEVRDLIRPDTPGGVAYAAKRLARTETNNAYHAMSTIYNADKPWNKGMVWKTSGSHPKPDICDLRADNSPYPLGEVPPKPHPQCLCYVYPKTVSRAEFVEQFNSGAYDRYIQQNYGRAA
jgi:hypothetical protein